MNLSRINPLIISSTTQGQYYFFSRKGGGGPAVFISAIVVGECSLLEPTIKAGRTIKTISGPLLEGEWERFVGAIGMILHERNFKGQLLMDNLSFSTSMFSQQDNCECIYLITLLYY